MNRPAKKDLARAGLLDGFELIIFDKDGTLIDFDAMWGGWVRDLAADVLAATSIPVTDRLFGAMGFDPVTGRALAGGPLAVLPMAGLRELAVGVLVELGCRPPEAEKAVEQAWRARDPIALARPVADLRSLFAALRASGLLLGVVTTDDRAPTEATLAALGIAPLLDALACGDDGLPVKPAPDTVLQLCRTLGVEPARTAVVGDSPVDLTMARAAGAGLSVGVLSGVGGRAVLEPLADVILPSVAALVEA